MRPIAMIGIDSFDSELVRRYGSHLPNLTRLSREGTVLAAESTYPPDSVTAWASIHTGLNPARHGMVYFKDPLDKVNATVNVGSDSTPIRGRALWDHVGDAGGRSLLVFPKGAFPLWPIRGEAVARSEVRDARFEANRPRWLDLMGRVARDHGLKDLNTLQHIPTSDRDLRTWLDKGRRLVEAEFDLARRMADETTWDLLILYSSVMDWVSHNFWPYCDEEDIDYRADGNPHRDVLRDLYVLYDREIGRLVDALPPETAILVLSDHGHGRRPRKVVHLNKILLERGLLVRAGRAHGDAGKPTLVERFRRATVGFVNRNKWVWNAAMRGLHWVPALRRFYTAPPTIDWDRSLAFITDQSGIKSYNYGGVRLNRRAIEAAGRDYEEVRGQVVDLLRGLTVPGERVPLCRNLYRREDLYDGPFVERMPEVIFELAHDYGAGWACHGDLVAAAPAGNICPGSHRRDTAFLLASRVGPLDEKRVVTPMDVTPTVLDLLGVPHPVAFDGRSILAEAEPPGTG